MKLYYDGEKIIGEIHNEIIFIIKDGSKSILNHTIYNMIAKIKLYDCKADTIISDIIQIYKIEDKTVEDFIYIINNMNQNKLKYLLLGITSIIEYDIKILDIDKFTESELEYFKITDSYSIYPREYVKNIELFVALFRELETHENDYLDFSEIFKNTLFLSKFDVIEEIIPKYHSIKEVAEFLIKAINRDELFDWLNYVEMLFKMKKDYPILTYRTNKLNFYYCGDILYED